MGQEVEADNLGDEFKGYVFKIAGGFDSDGFAMKQGIFSNGRIRLLLSPGSKGYRASRKGERKRRSVRGCIVGPDIKMLSCIVTKKGEKEIPGLTDTVTSKRLGPKKASGIRKLFGISKAEGVNTTALIKKNVIRRTFKSKKNPDAAQRQKAPKIQRLVTEVRLRRKRIAKESKVRKWKKSLAAADEYKKVYDKWISKRKAAAHEAKAIRKASESAEKKAPVADKAPKKVEAPKKAAGKVAADKGAAKTTKPVVAAKKK